MRYNTDKVNISTEPLTETHLQTVNVLVGL